MQLPMTLNEAVASFSLLNHCPVGFGHSSVGALPHYCSPGQSDFPFLYSSIVFFTCGFYPLTCSVYRSMPVFSLLNETINKKMLFFHETLLSPSYLLSRFAWRNVTLFSVHPPNRVRKMAEIWRRQKSLKRNTFNDGLLLIRSRWICLVCFYNFSELRSQQASCTGKKKE